LALTIPAFFWICFSVFITVVPFILAIKNYEIFYITETEIIVKNPFKKLNVIKKQDITNIYVERFVVGPTYLGSYWQYIVIATNDNKVNQWNYLNGKKDYILIDFSCKNEDIINEWTENKFDLYE